MFEAVGGRLRRFARDDLIRHGAIVFVSQSAVNLLSFAFHAAVSRRLGVASYGSLGALLAGFTVLAVPATIAATVVAKYAAEFAATGDVARLRALTLRIVNSLGPIALAVLIAAALFAPALSGYLQIDDRRSIVLTGAILALGVVLPVLRGILQGTEDFRGFALSALIEGAVKVALALILTHAGFGLNGALAGWLGGSLVSLLWTAGVLALRYRGVGAAPLRLDYARLVATSGGVALAILCLTSLGFSDVVIVKHAFDARAAGLYGATSLAGKVVYWLVAFVPTVTLPRAVNRAATGKPVLPLLMQATAIVACLAAVGLLVYAYLPAALLRIVTGPDFEAAAPLLFPYGVASALLAVLNTAVLYKIGIHRFGFVIPLASIALGELVALALFHDTLYEVIAILIVAEAVALIATLVSTPERRQPGASAGH